MSDAPSLPAGVDALVSEVEALVGGDISERHLYAGAVAVGYYLSTRNAPRAVVVALLAMAVMRLQSIDGRLEEIGEMDPEQRAKAMRNLEQPVAPETNDE